MEYKLKRSDAFALLRDAARKQRRKLADMASAVVSAREMLSLDTLQRSLGTSVPIVNTLDPSNPLR